MYAASTGVSIVPPHHRPPIPAGQDQFSITRPVCCLESGNSTRECLHRCTPLGRRDLHRPGTDIAIDHMTGVPEKTPAESAIRSGKFDLSPINCLTWTLPHRKAAEGDERAKA